MARKQRYDQVCPVASGMDMIGNRWAVLVIRELVLGPRRFTDIHSQLENASTDMVAARLRELQADGLVERTTDRRYQLTSRGHALAPVIRALLIWSLQVGAFGGQSLDSSADLPRRLLSMLATVMRTTAAATRYEPVQLHVGELQASVADDGRYLIVTEVTYESTDQIEGSAANVISLSPAALLDLMLSGRKIDELASAGEVTVTGEAAQMVAAEIASAVRLFRQEAVPLTPELPA